MKNWNNSFMASKLYRAGFSLLLLSLIATGAFAQARVNRYTVTTPSLTWTDLSTSGGTIIENGIWKYYNGSIATTLPFAFNYDNTVVSSGTTLYINEASIDFGTSIGYGATAGGLGSSSYPALLCPFAGTRMNDGGRFWSNNAVYTQLTGTSPNRVFTIQMNNVHGPCIGASSEGSSIQVKLFETTNVIEFIYQSHNATVNTCGTYYAGNIGLNGFTSPSFVSVTEVTNSSSTPPTDYVFTSPPPPQELSLNPNPKTVNFGTTTPSAPITNCTITAKSVGGAGTTLHITGTPYISGSSAFTIVSGPGVTPGQTIPYSLPVGSSVSWCVQFLPLSSGGLSGTFNLTTDGIDSALSR